MQIIRPYPYARENGLWQPMMSDIGRMLFENAKATAEFYQRANAPRRPLWDLCDEIQQTPGDEAGN